jgi:hypothetical protein
LDALVVATTSFNAYVAPIIIGGGDIMNMNFARLMRLLKVVKIFRAFRAAQLFSELRVLIHTLTSSILALLWSTVLLALIMVASGILMGQLVLHFIDDDTYERKMRLWAYEHYGGAFRSIYTMFEATLSGGWPNYARPLISGFSPWFALFWVFYVLAVYFAVIRVLSALFLNTTMNVANQDEEMMMMAKIKEMEKFTERVGYFFQEADTSGDGMIDRDEFETILEDDRMKVWLEALGLEVYEVQALFNLLCDDVGEISYEDFLGGAKRMKGQAKAIDSITIMHGQHKLKNSIFALNEQICEGLSTLWQEMHLESSRNPWAKSANLDQPETNGHAPESPQPRKNSGVAMLAPLHDEIEIAPKLSLRKSGSSSSAVMNVWSESLTM